MLCSSNRRSCSEVPAIPLRTRFLPTISYLSFTVQANHGSAGSTKAPSGKPSYSAMVMDAITNMNEKNGSSLVAIRKYIQTNFSLKQQQTASFNSLTLKALQKLLALDQLEKVGSSFRVSNAEKERKKQEAKREQQALRIAERNAAKLAAKAPAKLKAAKVDTMPILLSLTLVETIDDSTAKPCLCY